VSKQGDKYKQIMLRIARQGIVLFFFFFLIVGTKIYIFLKPCLFVENEFVLEIKFLKKNYFLMCGSVMKNKLKNIFQYLVKS